MTTALIILTAISITFGLIAVVCFAVLFFRISKRMRKHRKETIDDNEQIKNDWEKIGQDMRKGILQYDKESK